MAASDQSSSMPSTKSTTTRPPDSAARKAGRRGGSNQELNTAQLSQAIGNLTNGVTYRVQVTAKNAAGYGTPSDEMSETPDTLALWSADMFVVEYTSVSIGAASADLFSYVGGSAGLQVKSLWSYTPGRDLRLSLGEGVLGAEGLTLQVGYLRLAFPGGSSGKSYFKWKDVDVDWEDGQTLAVRIGRNTLATGAPGISGAITIRVGETLTADTTGIADADGLDSATFSYQWVSNDGTTDSDIQDAIDSTYTPVPADEGKTIKVRVSFTDKRGFAESLTSPATVAVVPPTNTPATGAPTISGKVQVGETLTASTSDIEDANGLDGVTFSYQWLSVHETMETEIEGATDATYTLLPAEEGKTIRVQVSFTDGHGFPESLPSDATIPVAPPPEAPGPPLNLEVRNDENGKLTLSWEAPASDGGSAITGYAVRWKSGNEEYHASRKAAVSGLSSKVGGLTNGVEYTLLVTAVNKVGDGEAAEITATPRDTIPPELLTARVNGPTITLNYDEALDANSTPPTSAFSVMVGGTAREVSEVSISGSSVSLTLASAVTLDDTVALSYSAPQDTGEQRVQDTTGNHAPSFSEEPVANDTPTPNTRPTGAPTIGGNAQVGETLTAEVADIDDDNGLDNATFSYQWLADDAEIPGATSSSYTLTEDDEGKTIKVRVSFTDDEGNAESLTSDPTGEVEAEPNTEATGAPAITGVARVGETLTADTSGIDDDDGLTNVVFSYQWVRSDGGADSNIQDATGSIYTLVAADEGKAIKVVVSFTDAEGNAETLTSDATGEVEAKPNTKATGAPTIDGMARVGQTLTADTFGIHDDDGLNNVAFTRRASRSISL